MTSYDVFATLRFATQRYVRNWPHKVWTKKSPDQQMLTEAGWLVASL